MELNGLDGMLAGLQHMETKGAARAARRGINAGGQVAVEAARDEAPQDSGTLAKSIGKRVDRTKDRSSYYARVGPRKGYEGTDEDGNPRKPQRYAHLVHEGHIASDGGYVPGDPFIERAVAQSEQQIADTIANKVGDSIIDEARKAAGGTR
jgi:HK97 gp10 family phage protein